MKNTIVVRNSKRRAVAGALALLAVYGSSSAIARTAEEVTAKPNAKDLLQSTGGGYQTPHGIKRECLGRLVFDVGGEIQWPTIFKGYGDLEIFARAFSENVAHPNDKMQIGETRVAVLGPLNAEQVTELYLSIPEHRIAYEKQRLKEELVQSSALPELPKDARERHSVYLSKRKITRLKESIEELKNSYEVFDSGIADSQGYHTTNVHDSGVESKYSVYRTYLRRGSYVYIFESERRVVEEGGKPFHREDFIKLLKSFRLRRNNEIPNDLGFCIPFGFIADNGTTASDIKQSLRWPDAPGVLYTIETGNVKENQLKSPTFNAAIKAGLGLFGTQAEENIKPHVSKRIGPRLYKIGGLTAQQGGIVFNVKKADAAPYQTYSVVTGYSGWLGTDVLPYILVEMNSHTIERAPELKQNPPTFEKSFSRLETLLKSMYLRPTQPLMPELLRLKPRRE